MTTVRHDLDDLEERSTAARGPFLLDDVATEVGDGVEGEALAPTEQPDWRLPAEASPAFPYAFDPYADIRAALRPEHAALTADEITLLFGRQPAVVALHRMLASGAPQHATLAILLGRAGRRLICLNGSNVPIPAYMRLLSRLCREAAEQGEHELDEQGVAPEPGVSLCREDAPQPDCAHLDESRLSWPGASSRQLDLMRRVYVGQVSRACRARNFADDVPTADLAEIEHGVLAGHAAAEACRRLLAAARAALTADLAATRVRRIGLVSGYRSASQQLEIWNRNFPRYYQDTRATRQALPGGEFGPAAADQFVSYISGRLAAPGYSYHNTGLALDFTTEQGGVSLGADTSAASRTGWRRSWFFRWLAQNATGYGFFQNTAIDEPWHWEFRGGAPAAQSHLLPFCDTESAQWDGMAPEAEALLPQAVAAGRAEFSGTPLLARHRGAQPDLILRWNDMAPPSVLDTVVHLHGYSFACARLSARDKEGESGLDFGNPDNAADGWSGRTRPTLGILPRGSFVGQSDPRKPGVFSFPALVEPSGISDLVTYSLTKFLSAVGTSSAPSPGRLILTAHSGGGDALLRALGRNAPDEVHVFDALYWDPAPLIAWLTARLSAELRTWAVTKAHADGGLCVLYTEGKTEGFSRKVLQALRPAIAAAPKDAQPMLRSAYRVLRTTAPHGDIPRRYGRLLLADVTQHLDQTYLPS